MKLVDGLVRIVVIILVVAAALYLFLGALFEEHVKIRHTGRTIVAIATVSTPTPQVIVATRDGNLYSFSLVDSSWHAYGSVPGSGAR